MSLMGPFAGEGMLRVTASHLAPEEACAQDASSEVALGVTHVKLRLLPLRCRLETSVFTLRRT